MPAVRIDTDFAVRNERELGAMHIFHWVFDGDDVAFRGTVAVIYHRGKRGGFARTRPADYQHQSTFVHHDIFKRFG